MNTFSVDDYVRAEFQPELDADLAVERKLSRRCLYAIAIVVAVIIARSLWFI